MAESKINIRALFDLKGFSTSAQNLERKMKQTARNLDKVGRQMSMAFTAPIAGLAVVALRNFDIQAKAVAQVEAGLKSTNGAVGITSKKLQQLASDIQGKSLFGDEEILKGVTAQLLTFTNIAGEQFEKTQQAAVDLATRLDVDLKSASIMLGKALNDPVANLSALSRAGIQFSEEQKATVKRMVETNRLAEAQSLILEELEKQYGGSAEAAAKAGLGPLKQLQMAFGDLTEQFGEIISVGILPLINKLKTLVTWFQNLSPTVKKMILAFSGVLAIAGPILMFVGALTAAMASLATATGIATAPILAIVLGLAALAAAFVYVKDNLGAFEDFFFNAWVNIKNGFIDSIKFMLSGYKKLADILGLELGKNTFEFLDSLKGKVRENTREFGSFGDAVESAIDSAKDNLNGLAETAETVTTKVTNSTAKMAKAFKVNLKEISHSISSVGIGSFGTDFDIKMLNFDKIDVPLAKAKEKALSVFQQIGAEMSTALNNGLESLANNSAVLMGEFLGGIISGSGESVADFGKQFLNVIGMFMQDFGKAIIAIGVAKSGLDAAIKTGNAPLAIVAGIALVAAGSALSNLSQKGIEGSGGGGGGYSSPSGSTNRNNLDLQPIVLETKIQGRELILVQDRSRQFKR